MLRRIQIGLRLLLGLAFFAVFGVIFVLVLVASPTTIVAPTPRPTTPSTPTTSSPTTSSPTTSTNKTSTTSESKRTTTSTSPTHHTPPSTSPCTTASMTTVTTSPDMPISNSTGDNNKSYLQREPTSHPIGMPDFHSVAKIRKCTEETTHDNHCIAALLTFASQPSSPS